jgi:hypothetical protein
MLLALIDGRKTQTTRDFVAWRWNRIIEEFNTGHLWMAVEKSQFDRTILGTVLILGAEVRRLGAMEDSEWDRECVTKMELTCFADTYLKNYTPVDTAEYNRTYTNTKKRVCTQHRKVGRLILGRFESCKQLDNLND